jgi:hypothetical protein
MFSRHVEEKLSAYHHAELGPEESRRVAAHLIKCERCRREYDEIKLGAALAASLTKAAAPDDLWREIEAKLWGPEVGSRKSEVGIKNLFRPPALSLFSLPTSAPRLVAAAGVAALIAVGLWLAWDQVRRRGQPPGGLTAQGPAWEVERIAGLPKVGASEIGGTGELRVGQWLETDAASRAALKVGAIGEVEVEENSRVRLVEAREEDHRIELQRGRLSATIWAPPRIFFVETPSATAVDLGCAYTLEVDDAGAGLLHVTLGYVSLVHGGRESYIPAGAMCETRPGAGPGTPFAADAPVGLRAALSKFDFEHAASALDTVLAEARADDALTLWHLLARATGEARARVYDRLAQLAPPPGAVTREGALGGDRRMLDLWWQEMGFAIVR